MKFYIVFWALLTSFCTFGFIKWMPGVMGPKKQIHSFLLTKEHIQSIMPKKLKNLKRTRLIIIKEKHEITAYYGNNEIALSIVDSAPNGFKEVEDFFESYYTTTSSQSVFRFLKIRNGYKTITEIRESKGKTNIAFVLYDRFIVNIIGLANQAPTKVWSYMELPKLKELEKYH